MSIKVRYFASLAEQVGRPEACVDFTEGMTVQDVWNEDNDSSLPSGVLAAVNLDYADLNAPVKENDEVAFFPPVTGG